MAGPLGNARALVEQQQRWLPSTIATDDEDVAYLDEGAPFLAKLTRPRLHNVVARKRLFALLDERRAHPLTWISGPPGAGKTTLIASYLESRQLAALWYRLDGDDVEPATFFHFLERACAHAGMDNSIGLPRWSERVSAATFTRAFFRELFIRLPRPAVLVLDDYQHLFENSEFHLRLVDAAREIPDGITVVIASCSEPPNVFSRLAANKIMSCVDWAELRLTLEETRAIACAARPVDEASVRWLHQQCDGWVAGLALMLTRMRRRGFALRHMEEEGRTAVFNYFCAEILDTASPAHQHVLLKSALLPRMTTASTDALCASSDGGLLLSDMHRRQMFVTRIPGSPSSYQYHPLLRAFLLARAQDTYAGEELKTLQHRAARILESEGEVLEAITLYEHAQDWDAAALLLSREAQSLLVQGRNQALREGIAALPVECSAARSWLCYWYGASLVHEDPARARHKFEQAFEFLKRADDQLGQMLAAAGMIQSHISEWIDLTQLDRWIEILEHLLAPDPTLSSTEVRPEVHAALLSALVARRPDHFLMPVCLQTVSAVLNSDTDANTRLLAATALMRYHGCNLDSAEIAVVEHAMSSLSSIDEVTPRARAAWLLELARSLALVFRREEALVALNRAAEISVGQDLAGIAGRIDQIKRLIHPTAEEHPVVGAESGVESADAAGCVPDQIRARILLAAIYAAGERHDEAAASLGEAKLLTAGTRFHSVAGDIDLIEAFVALRRNDPVACGAVLERALSWPTGTPIPSPLLARHPAMLSELCAEALRQNIQPERARQLIGRHQLVPVSKDIEAWPWPVKIYTLGGFRVVKNGVEIRFKGKAQKRPLELLQALIALGGTDVAVSTLAEALWPDADGDAAYHAFENALYRLRQLLGVTGVLALASGRLTLDQRHCWVDVWTFERRLGAVHDADDQSIGALEATVQLYRGHFLEQEALPSWALAMRERLRDKFVRHVRWLARSFEQTEAWGDAAAIYQRALELDNLTEDLYRGLMICYRELGNHAEAVKAFRRCRELLSIVLGVQPSEQTRAVYATLRPA